MLGGPGALQDPTDEVKALAQEMKGQTEAKLGATFGTFEAVKFKRQVVNGTNFFIKVKVGPEQFVHIKVYQKLPCYGGTKELTEAKGGQTLDSALEF